MGLGVSNVRLQGDDVDGGWDSSQRARSVPEAVEEEASPLWGVRVLLEYLPLPHALFDAEGELVAANNAWLTLWGDHESPTRSPSRWLDALAPEERDEAKTWISCAAKRPWTTKTTWHLQRVAGPVRVQVHARGEHPGIVIAAFQALDADPVNGAKQQTA